MKTTTIRQSVFVRGAKPGDIYEMLLDSRKHAAFTEFPARINRREGGKFEAGGDSEEEIRKRMQGLGYIS